MIFSSAKKYVIRIDLRLELVCPLLAWFANILQTLQKFCIMHSWQRVDTDWGFATLARPHSLLMCPVQVHLIGHSSGRLMSHQDTQKCYIIIEILYYLCHTEIHSSVVLHQDIGDGQWSYHDIAKHSCISHPSIAVDGTKFWQLVTLRPIRIYVKIQYKSTCHCLLQKIKIESSINIKRIGCLNQTCLDVSCSVSETATCSESKILYVETSDLLQYLCGGQ